MARISEIQAGLEIFRRIEGDSSNISAEHDVFYAGCTPGSDLSKQDMLTLQQSGWYWDDSLDCWYHFI